MTWANAYTYPDLALSGCDRRPFFFQILQAQGKHQSRPELPFVLGSEFAGVVSRDSPIPPDCSLRPGDRVFGYAQGAYADKVLADPGQLLPLPKNLTFDQGAGAPVSGFLFPWTECGERSRNLRHVVD